MNRMVQAVRAILPPVLTAPVTDAELYAEATEILEGEREVLLCAHEGIITRREATNALLARLHTWLIDRAGCEWLDCGDTPEGLLVELEHAIFARPPMTSQVAEAWKRGMMGPDADVDEIVSAALGVIVSGGPVEARQGHGRIEFLEPPASCVVASVHAEGKLRMVCARLAVVFGEAAAEPPCLYGGTIEAHVPVDGAIVHARLEMMNRPGIVWFKLSRI